MRTMFIALIAVSGFLEKTPLLDVVAGNCIGIQREEKIQIE